MPTVIDNQSQQAPADGQVSQTVSQTIELKVLADSETAHKPNECTGDDSDCACNTCAAQNSLFGQAACVMVGASSHASERSARRKLGAQSLHWGVLFVGMMFSIPFVLPTLSPASQDWMMSHVMNSPGNWKLLAMCTFACGLFAMGFVNRLGKERVQGGCAMLRRLGPAAILGVAWSTIPSFAGVMLVLNMEPIRMALVGNDAGIAHMLTGLSIYLIGFVILAGLGFLPTVSQAILAGYAFGVPIGLAAALIGFGGASLVGYELVGRFARSRVEGELQRKPKALMIRDALIRANTGRALLIVTLLRASPSAPFALTNLLLGSLGVSRGVFFFGTIIGMLPRTLAAVLIGQQFTGWNGHIDKPRWMIIAGIVSAILLVIVISKVAASALIRVTGSTKVGSGPVLSS